MTQFSIVVPTLNESENIDLLLSRLFALNLDPDSFEVIFVDDGSTDGTPDKIRAWESRSNVRLVQRQEKPDLTASILAGTATAKSDVIVVMDADLSHPPERLSAVVTPVLDGTHDVVVGSRYIAGVSLHFAANWPLVFPIMRMATKFCLNYSWRIKASYVSLRCLLFFTIEHMARRNYLFPINGPIFND